MGVDVPLLSTLCLFPLRSDVKCCLFLLEPEDDAEDVVVTVNSNNNDDDRETRDVKGLLAISSI